MPLAQHLAFHWGSQCRRHRPLECPQSFHLGPLELPIRLLQAPHPSAQPSPSFHLHQLLQVTSLFAASPSKTDPSEPLYLVVLTDCYPASGPLGGMSMGMGQGMGSGQGMSMGHDYGCAGPSLCLRQCPHALPMHIQKD